MRTLIPAWRAAHSSLPTTPAGVEFCAAAVFLGVRLVGLIQLGVALPAVLDLTTSPPMFAVVLAAYATESALIAVAVVRAGRYRSTRWGWTDTSVAALVLLSQPAFTTAADRTGSWTAWGFALTLGSAAGAAIVFSRLRETVLAVAVLTGCYLTASLSGAESDHMRTTVVSNAFAYVGFSVLTRFLVGYLRRLGADADSARRAAAEAAAKAARLEEHDRQRVLLHDNIGVLHLLADPDLPPSLAEPLRTQAESLANRVRAFLDDVDTGTWEPAIPVPDELSEGRALTRIVHAAAADFGDLPLEISVDLATGVVLAPVTADTVQRALATLLANVRLHAGASSVVVHGDADEAQGVWEITVRDNGCGFDTATTPRGFGLRVQVEQALEAQQVSAHVHSVPGDGTTITLHGRMESTR
ncbi:MAG: ATP-binding protein [Actinoallomurus sp.]